MTYDSVVVQSNIREIYDQHKMEDYKNGSRWYKDANGFSLDIAKEYNVKPHIAAGVISALSPMKSWDVNMKLAHTFFKKGWRSVGHYTLQKLKARDVSKTFHPYQVDEILGGLKTINFYHNIYQPNDTQWLTVDRHMSVIAVGSIYKFTPKQYNFIKEEYRKFSQEIGMDPVTLQAMLWCTFKRVKGEL